MRARRAVAALLVLLAAAIPAHAGAVANWHASHVRLLPAIGFRPAMPLAFDVVCVGGVGGCGATGGSFSGGVVPSKTTFGSAVDAANTIRLGDTTGCITFEGASADANEHQLCTVDPTADVTFNLQALAAGTYRLTAQSNGALTSGRVPIVTTNGVLADDSDLTFSTDTLTATKIIGSTSITDTGLTAGRVTFAGTAGILSDDSDMTFATDTLTVTKIAGTTFTGANTFSSTNSFIDGNHSIIGSSDATKVLKFEVDGFTTGTTRTATFPDANTTLPVATQVLTFSGPTAARTITLPDAAFSVAGVNTANTFSANQSTPDANFFLVDDGDATKKLQFQLSGITTSNTVVPFSFGGTAAAPTIFFPLGAAATPSVMPAGGTNSGMWARATTAVDFSAAGAGVLEIQVGSLQVPNTANFSWLNGALGATADLTLRRKAAAVLQMGTDANGAVTAQQLQGANGITGTDIVAGNLALGGQVGTGAGAGSQTTINRALILGTGTTAQSNANAVAVCESKSLSTTTATATAVANIGLANNTAGGVRAEIGVQCSDGTNFDSDLLTTYVAYVNKAGTLTIGTPVTTGTAAANNSGSCTVAPTIVANGTTSIDVKVTPVFSTIVPTSVTAYVLVHNFGAGAVTCK